MDIYEKKIPDEITFSDLYNKIRELFYKVKKKWQAIAVFAIIGAALGYFYAYFQPTNYIAKITFVVEEGKSSSSSLGGLASIAGQFGVDVGSNAGGGVFSGDNILLYFRSNNLAKEVLLTEYDSINNKSIADFYSEVYQFKKEWEGIKNIGNINFPPNKFNNIYSRLQDSLLQKLIDLILKDQFLVGKTDKKAGFVDVLVKMRNENLAKVYCERVVSLAVEKYLAIKTQRQQITVNKLQARVDSISNLLNLKTYSGASLQTTSNTMDINPLYKTNSSVALETTVREKSMLATIFASVLQNLELAKFTLSQETPVIQVIDNPSKPLKKEKISEIKTAIGFSVLSVFISIFLILLQNSKMKKNNTKLKT